MSNHNFEPTWPTRRKVAGSCHWCGEHLTPGVTYASFGQVFDGRFTRLNMHGVCFHLGWSKYREEEFSPHEMERGKPLHREDCG